MPAARPDGRGAEAAPPRWPRKAPIAVRYILEAVHQGLRDAVRRGAGARGDAVRPGRGDRGHARRDARVSREAQAASSRDSSRASSRSASRRRCQTPAAALRASSSRASTTSMTERLRDGARDGAAPRPASPPTTSTVVRACRARSRCRMAARARRRDRPLRRGRLPRLPDPRRDAALRIHRRRRSRTGITRGRRRDRRADGVRRADDRHRRGGDGARRRRAATTRAARRRWRPSRWRALFARARGDARPRRGRRMTRGRRDGAASRPRGARCRCSISGRSAGRPSPTCDRDLLAASSDADARRSPRTLARSPTALVRGTVRRGRRDRSADRRAAAATGASSGWPCSIA